MEQEDIDMHQAALSKMCRICGELIFIKKNLTSVMKHKDAVRAIFKVNLDEDKEGIHPITICNKCRLSTGRAFKKFEEGKNFPGTLPALVFFYSHRPSCTVCTKYAARMKSIQPAVKKSSQASESTSTSTAPESEIPSTSTSLPTLQTVTRDLIFSETVPDPGMAEHGKRRVWKAKKSLKNIDPVYRRKRTKEAANLIEGFCSRQKESKTDVLYFLLTESLRETNDHRRKEVMDSWSDKLVQEVTADHCLAMRVTTLTSKSKYKEQSKQMRHNGKNILKPSRVLDELEKKYMPGNVRFRLEGAEDIIYHTPIKAGQAHMEYGLLSFEPEVIQSEIHPGFDVPPPNFQGVHWNYSHALAKTLEELDEDIASGLEGIGINAEEDIEILTTIKDGADGMGDVSIMREASDRLLPDKAFRAAFAVIRCEVMRAGERVTIYEPPNLNSVTITRPLLECIGDENNAASATCMLHTMEQHREAMQGKQLAVNIDSMWRRHKLTFYNSMIDEKLDRADGGLQGSGSKYLCTLCHATRETARTEVGSFHIDRDIDETRETAAYLNVNPDKKSILELSEIAQGVKDFPVLMSNPKQKLIDATHADINIGSFFKKLIICEMARSYTWEITRDVKPQYDHAEKEFNDHIRATLGLVSGLMMPGNYARELFSSENTETILQLIPSMERKQQVAHALKLFQSMRSVYRASRPDKKVVASYKKTATELGLHLLTHFNYVNWPNYLHKIIEHVQEILEDGNGPLTVGGLSGEGNEAANKLFRDLRRSFSRKGCVRDSLRDILWFHWLYTSPKLRRISKQNVKKYTCSKCNGLGHSASNCNAEDKIAL